MQGQKASGFNVSSAYVLKSDMESSFPVDAVLQQQGLTTSDYVRSTEYSSTLHTVYSVRNERPLLGTYLQLSGKKTHTPPSKNTYKNSDKGMSFFATKLYMKSKVIGLMIA